MRSITLNSVNGTPPYRIFACDSSETDCTLVYYTENSIPPSVEIPIPTKYSTAPSVRIKVYNTDGCILIEDFNCITPTPTPTPTITPTIPPTPSLTPSITPTISLTPSNTPTISVTPSITPSTTVTPTVTNTPTPSSLPETPQAYLFIEPFSASSSIGNYMYNNGSTGFYGFTNATQPSSSSSAFTLEMNLYCSYSGWTNGELPAIVKSQIPQVTSGFDSLGNPIISYNFQTVQIPPDSVLDNAWYTWIIPPAYTNNQYQLEIGLSDNNPNIFTSVYTEPTIYSNSFYYSGGTIAQYTYRVYTSYPDPTFRINNNTVLYFKGSEVG